MGKIFFIRLLLIVLISITKTFAQHDMRAYLNEVPPDTVPKIFAPGKVSTENDFEFGAVFSNDGKEFYYGVEINGKAETRSIKYDNGKWGMPTTILVHDVYSFNDPFLTSNDKKLFFISDRSLTGTGPKKDYDIWYVERQQGKWSEPRNAGPNINSDKNEYYISFTKADKMYFSSNKNDNYDIYSSVLEKGVFQPSANAGVSINTASYEADVFVAPDESYIVFAANRPVGLGNGDLYVSFRTRDGKWTTSESLGSGINTQTDDFCPYVTNDGKYLFYASRGDIYWVSTDVIWRFR